MNGRGSKAKGSNFERELAAYINECIGLDCHRAPLSGGGEGVNLRMTLGADLVGTPLVHIEAKRTERFQPEAAMTQAEVSICKVPDPYRLPVVINRKNRQPIGNGLVVMRLDGWLALYELALEQYRRQQDGV